MARDENAAAQEAAETIRSGRWDRHLMSLASAISLRQAVMGAGCEPGQKVRLPVLLPAVTRPLLDEEVVLMLRRYGIQPGESDVVTGFAYPDWNTARRYAERNKNLHGHRVLGPWKEGGIWCNVVIVEALGG